MKLLTARGGRRLLALLLGLDLAAALAASSAASSALDSLSTSVGMASGSISSSLSSASPGRAQVAQGPYRVVALQRAPAQPHWTLVALEPAAQGADAAPWQLRLPAALVESAGLAPGGTVVVRHRPYGLGIWQDPQPQPLYLVLHDDWAHALVARPLAEGAAAAR